MKPTSGGNKNGRWEIEFDPQPININPVPDPDWPLRTGSRQQSAERPSHPESEPTAAVRITRSSSKAAIDARKGSQSSVNQGSKGQKQRQATKRDGDQPPQRNRGGSVPSEATSGRRGAGSGTRKFTLTESKISEEVLSEDIPPPQETAKPKKVKDQTGRTNRDSQQQPKSTKHTTTKPQNPSNPDSTEIPKQPSPNYSHLKPSPGASIPPKQNDSSAQDSSTQRAITTNPNPKPNRPTTDKTTSDTHKMPLPPNSYKIFPRTPAKPTDQQGPVPQTPQPRSKKRSRNEPEPEEGTFPHPNPHISKEIHTDLQKSAEHHTPPSSFQETQARPSKKAKSVKKATSV